MVMESPSQDRILSHTQILRKTRRIAYEIYEQNFQEHTVMIGGIEGQGVRFAEILAEILTEIAPFEVQTLEIRLDKSLPCQAPVQLSMQPEKLTDCVIIIADDVLNTGRTLAFSLQPFLAQSVRKIQVAVLVDRNHRTYPIAADYVGYALSTTVNQHIEVRLGDPGNYEVYLH
jgi:pyrimidine operon attenuation protein/uracil phosphoribosyltransferase